MQTASAETKRIDERPFPGGTFVRPFSAISAADVPLVGGKNASLGEMYRTLSGEGVPIPNGFAVTAEAYRHVLDEAHAWEALRATLEGIDPSNMLDLAQRAERARNVISACPLPAELTAQILAAYHHLLDQYGPDTAVAVRSSATAEDLPNVSFAGQHESYLNVRGDEMLLAAYRQCLASLFTERAVHYRIDQGFDHFKVALSVGIMKMVRSDLATSGVAFTLDTESGFRDVVFVTASYGMGENIVQGAVDPDEFYVHKPTYAAGFRTVLRRRIGSKRQRMICGPAANAEPGHATYNVDTSDEERRRACITDDNVLTLAAMCMTIERHFSALAGAPVPMDVEWAQDGPGGTIFIVQARPETVASQRAVSGGELEDYRFLAEPGTPILTGRAIGAKIASGKARLVLGIKDLEAFVPGEILVADMTSPDWEPVMKTAAGIVTNRGGRTCHAAIVARELGIPAVIGTETATTSLKGAQEITLSCAHGDTGAVYAGAVPFELKRTAVGDLPPAPVKVMVTIGDPDLAFSTSFIPNDGVGLARMEFIVSNDIKVHPMALVHPERVTDAAARAQILALTASFATPADYFVQRLSEGVATIAAAFCPKPVIVRMSDFKTNEYATLLGGASFEPAEANPMLGLRGASRYTHPSYEEGFALECAAMRRVRGEMGFTNVILMIPFCRRVDEAKRVIDRMATLGLRRGEGGLEIYVMCEIPNNVIQIDAFSECFDGFSIGSNDLTQLVLGVDRDSDLVAFDYDERDPGVLEMLRLTIEGGKRNHRHVGICGQAPSDYPDVAKFLVGLGIDSISLDPDTVIKTRLQLAK
jgi:pyruvate,water dikinase